MKKIVASLFLVALLVTQAATGTASTVTKSFDDVPNFSPYYPYIQDLKDKGVLVGKGDGNFYPTETLTRAQFATMLAQAFQLAPAKSKVRFADTEAHWSAKYVAACNEAGAVAGTSTTTFEPEKTVQRQEAAAMVWRLLERSGVEPSKQDITLSDKTADWATSAVKSVLAYELHGVDAKMGAYRSGEAMTRQEAAALFSKALKQKPTTSIVVNPTTNPTNLIESKDGWNTPGNVTATDELWELNEIPKDQAKGYLELFSRIRVKIDGNKITVSVPSSGNVNHIWTVQDTNRGSWDFSDAKTIEMSNVSAVSIMLADQNTGGLLMVGALNKEDGTWSMRYMLN